MKTRRAPSFTRARFTATSLTKRLHFRWKLRTCHLCLGLGSKFITWRMTTWRFHSQARQLTFLTGTKDCARERGTCSCIRESLLTPPFNQRPEDLRPIQQLSISTTSWSWSNNGAKKLLYRLTGLINSVCKRFQKNCSLFMSTNPRETPRHTSRLHYQNLVCQFYMRSSCTWAWGKNTFFLLILSKVTKTFQKT